MAGYAHGVNQQVLNYAKAGSYYTDLEHCRKIASHLEFDTEFPILALEPSIGDGEGILTALRIKENPHIQVYGVELRPEAAAETREKVGIRMVLTADYLRDMRISHQAFDVVFSNPPYGRTEDQKYRLETEFLRKISEQLKIGGVLIWIVPCGLMNEREHGQVLFNNFKILKMYRFDDKEFGKYHQIVFFLEKKKVTSANQGEQVDLRHYGNVSGAMKIPVLTYNSDPEQRISIKGMKTRRLREFKVKELDVSRAFQFICGQKGQNGMLWQSAYNGHERISVPKLPSKDSIYMMMAGGVGSGFCGDEDHRHLQRGSVLSATHEEAVYREKDGIDVQCAVKVRSYHSASITVLQADGTITRLGKEDDE